MNKKPLILGVRKTHFFIYLITLLIGIISSILSIVIGIKYNNSTTGYFLSLTASLVVTSIFAYFIDLANNRENLSEIDNQRKTVLMPVIISILTFLLRIIPSHANKKLQSYTLKDYENELHKIMDEYINCIELLSKGNRDLKLVNESFNIKNIEIYSIRDLESKLQILITQQEMLVMKNIINRQEFSLLDILYKDVIETKFPYLSSDNDKNISKLYVDWPTNKLSDLDMKNLHTKITILFNSLDMISNNIKEFNCIKNIKFNNTQN